MGCEKKGAEWETISTTPKVQNNEASRYFLMKQCHKGFKIRISKLADEQV